MAVGELHPCSQVLILSSDSFLLSLNAMILTLTYGKRRTDKERWLSLFESVADFCLSSEVVAKQDHKSAVLLLSLGHQARHTVS